MSIVTPKTNFFTLLQDLIEYLDKKSDYKGGEYNLEAKLLRRCEIALNELEEL